MVYSDGAAAHQLSTISQCIKIQPYINKCFPPAAPDYAHTAAEKVP